MSFEQNLSKQELEQQKLEMEQKLEQFQVQSSEQQQKVNSDKPLTLQEQGNEAFNIKDYIAAKQFYMLALQKEPTNFTLWSNKALTNLKLDLPQYAVSDAIISTQLEPDFHKPYFHLGMAFMAMGGLKHSKINFMRCLDLQPNNKDAQQKLQEVCQMIIDTQYEQQKSGSRYSSFYQIQLNKFKLDNELRQKHFQEQNQEIKIQNSSCKGGLGLYSQTDIEINQTISQDNLLFSISYNPNQCNRCSKKMTDAKITCPICKNEDYCSEECMEKAKIEYHGRHCNHISSKIQGIRKQLHSLGEQVLPICTSCHVLGAIRVAEMTLMQQSITQSFDLPIFKNLLKQRDDPDNDIFNSVSHPFKNRYQQYRTIVATLEFDPLLLAVFDFEWYDNVWSMLTVNLQQAENQVAILMNTFSMINHNCNPNSKIVCEGDKVTLKAIRNIQNNEEITVSYIDSSKEKDERQFNLQNYMFICKCEKCEDKK